MKLAPDRESERDAHGAKSPYHQTTIVLLESILLTFSLAINPGGEAL